MTLREIKRDTKLHISRRGKYIFIYTVVNIRRETIKVDLGPYILIFSRRHDTKRSAAKQTRHM